MLYKIFISTFFIGLISCSNQSENKVSDKPQAMKDDSKKLIASFTIDDNAINIQDKFSIILINNGDSLNTSIKGNQITIPSLTRDTGYTVVFKYNNYILPFHGLTKQMLFSGQDMEWKFGIDNRPFNHSLGLLSEGEFNTDKTTKQLQYLQFSPMERGDGIQFVNKIK